MRRLLVLALALTAAACGSAGVSTTRVQAPLAIGGTSTVALGKVFPVINGQVVHEGSVECTGLAPVSYVPSPARVTEIRSWTERALRWDLDHGVLVSPLGVTEAKRLLQYLPNIRFFDRPTYNYSRWPDGTWVWACAQGFSGFDGPKVAADDPARTERLVVHETTNWFYGVIQRRDLWDSSATQATVDSVGTQLTGGWRTE